jgi:hypothetical protein
MEGSRKARGIIHVAVNFVFAISIAILGVEGYKKHQLYCLSY